MGNVQWPRLVTSDMKVVCEKCGWSQYYYTDEVLELRVMNQAYE